MNLSDWPGVSANPPRQDAPGQRYITVMLENLLLGEQMTALRFSGIYLRKTDSDVVPILYKRKLDE